jgi:hypothetical protein
MDWYRTAPARYEPTVPPGLLYGRSPFDATAALAQSEATIHALRSENKMLRRELRHARAEVRENRRLREEQLRLTVCADGVWLRRLACQRYGCWGRWSRGRVALYHFWISNTGFDDVHLRHAPPPRVRA